LHAAAASAVDGAGAADGYADDGTVMPVVTAVQPAMVTAAAG
jgi:hypothetical protein